VSIDEVATGIQPTTHVIDVGCKTIAHIAGLKGRVALDRQTCFDDSGEHGLTLPPEYLLVRRHIDDSSDTVGYEGMKGLLQLNPRPDGVSCCNDAIAIWAMRAIFEAGLRIPGDIAVVGCGNAHYEGRTAKSVPGPPTWLGPTARAFSVRRSLFMESAVWGDGSHEDLLRTKEEHFCYRIYTLRFLMGSNLLGCAP